MNSDDENSFSRVDTGPVEFHQDLENFRFKKKAPTATVQGELDMFMEEEKPPFNVTVTQTEDPGTKLELDLLQQKVADLEHDRDMRKRYAPFVFWLIAIWLIVIFLLTVFDGINGNDFDLDVSVVIVLWSGLPVSIMGLLAIVLNWMFPRRDKGQGTA